MSADAVVANGKLNGGSGTTAPAPPQRQPTLEEVAAAQMAQLDLEGNKLPTPVPSRTKTNGTAQNGVRQASPATSATKINTSYRPTTRSSSTNNGTSRSSSTARSASSSRKPSQLSMSPSTATTPKTFDSSKLPPANPITTSAGTATQNGADKTPPVAQNSAVSSDEDGQGHQSSNNNVSTATPLTLPGPAINRRMQSIRLKAKKKNAFSAKNKPPTDTSSKSKMNVPQPNRVTLCPCGQPDYDDRYGMIACDSCDTWFHSICQNLSEEDVEHFGQPDLQWYCNDCGALPVTQTQDPIDKDECPNCHQLFKKPNGLLIHQGKTKCYVVQDSSPSPLSSESLAAELAILKKKRVLKRIPKGARMLAAYKLSERVEQCVTVNSLDSWKSLLQFPYIAFQAPAKDKKSLASKVKKNINSGQLPDDSAEDLTNGTPLNWRVQSKVSDGDTKGAVRLMTSTDTLALQCEETYEALSTKHPEPSREMNFPDSDFSECLRVDDKTVLKAIRSFSNGSSGGIDGLTSQHLKDLCTQSNKAGEKLVSSLTSLCNTILAGNICEEVRPIFFGAGLVALKKKDGGIRPIAVGLTYRRLASKLACQSVYEEMGDYLRPHQLGFATKGGCEAAVHATRSFIPSLHTGNIILKVDVKNAFNSVDRDVMLSRIKEKAPYLYAFFNSAYRESSYLFYNDKIIHSRVGAQQGDLSGPLLFSVAIHTTIMELLSDLNVWYLDDGTIGGDPSVVLEDFKTIIKSFASFGLEVIPLKCELYHKGPIDDTTRNEFIALAPGLVFSEENFTLLGSPLDDTAVAPCLAKKKAEIQLMIERMSTLKSHVAYFLLKHALGIPKLVYFLRTAPFWKLKDELIQIDAMFQSCLESVMNVSLTPQQFQIASFPTSLGGLGIRKTTDLALPAFLSSVNSTLGLINTLCPFVTDESNVIYYSEALSLWTAINSELPDLPSCQKCWDSVSLDRLTSSLNFTNDTTKAIYLASCRPESSGWLTVLPSKALNTLLDDNTFKIAAALRLGCNICTPHQCVCGGLVDSLAHHGLHCIKSAGRHYRHSQLNIIIQKAIASTGTPARLEPNGLSRDDGKKPDGATLVTWWRGQILVWDATCLSTTAPSYLASSAKDAGHAASVGAERKTNKYKEVANQDHYFVPFSVETFGPFCVEARALVYEIGKRLRECTGEPRSRLFLTQRLSIAIQRGNAASVMGTFENSSCLDELFYLF